MLQPLFEGNKSRGWGLKFEGYFGFGNAKGASRTYHKVLDLFHIQPQLTRGVRVRGHQREAKEGLAVGRCQTGQVGLGCLAIHGGGQLQSRRVGRPLARNLFLQARISQLRAGWPAPRRRAEGD